MQPVALAVARRVVGESAVDDFRTRASGTDNLLMPQASQVAVEGEMTSVRIGYRVGTIGRFFMVRWKVISRDVAAN